MALIKVSSSSRTSSVAGATARMIRENNRAKVQAIGAGAVNQAVKALILANKYLKQDGIAVFMMPQFADMTINEKVKTATKLIIDSSKVS